ncbi:MAG: RsmE family RNA methyltransferase [Acidimicrobiales bacterium]
MIQGPSGHDGPHVFVIDLDRPVLEDGDRHHLSRVLRLRRGDPLTVSDGEGRWRAARFGSEIEPSGPLRSVPPSPPPITIAFALLKGERLDWVTQKLTELGVDEIRPFVAVRSVVRWDEAKAIVATQRLRKVAREAAMQSRRCRLPTVHPPGPWGGVAALPGAALAERDGGPVTLAHPTVLIGPEGGWAPEERAGGLPRVGLGPLVLRAETAAIAAGVLLTARRVPGSRIR